MLLFPCFFFYSARYLYCLHKDIHIFVEIKRPQIRTREDPPKDIFFTNFT
jgi:hypothetical protein